MFVFHFHVLRFFVSFSCQFANVKRQRTSTSPVHLYCSREFLLCKVVYRNKRILPTPPLILRVHRNQITEQTPDTTPLH